MRKIWITAGVVAALFVVVIVAGDALSLASLQASQAQLTARYAASPFAFIAVFSLLYIGATALSLPLPSLPRPLPPQRHHALRYDDGRGPGAGDGVGARWREH